MGVRVKWGLCGLWFTSLSLMLIPSDFKIDDCKKVWTSQLRQPAFSCTLSCWKNWTIVKLQWLLLLNRLQLNVVASFLKYFTSILMHARNFLPLEDRTDSYYNSSFYLFLLSWFADSVFICNSLSISHLQSAGTLHQIYAYNRRKKNVVSTVFILFSFFLKPEGQKKEYIWQPWNLCSFQR